MEHILLMAQEQVDLEFMEEKQRMQQLQQQIKPMMQQAQENPMLQQQLQQNPQIQQVFQAETNLQMQMEARKSTLIAEFTDDYAEAEKEVLSQVENDPLLKLKDRELDLKAREEELRSIWAGVELRNDRIVDATGMKFRSLDTSIRDCVESLISVAGVKPVLREGFTLPEK